MSCCRPSRRACRSAVRKAAERITAERLARDLEYLSSDELKGRNTPSPGFDRAAGYIVGRLGKAGLEPAGDNGTFLQHYTMRESEVDTAAATIEIDGRRFRFGDDFVMRAFAGPVSGTRAVVYVGHGWTVPGRNIDPFAGVDVKGKIVVAHGPRALPKGVEIPLIGRVNVGASPVFAEAERRGAAAVLFIAQASALDQLDAGADPEHDRARAPPERAVSLRGRANHDRHGRAAGDGRAAGGGASRPAPRSRRVPRHRTIPHRFS